jgi:hypothetical protein
MPHVHMLKRRICLILIDAYHNKKEEAVQVVEQKRRGGASYLAGWFYSSPSFHSLLCCYVTITVAHYQ